MTNHKRSTNHDLGAFYTPNEISSYVAKKLVDYISTENYHNLNEITVLDPTCGDGALLKSFEAELNKKIAKNVSASTFSSDSKPRVFGLDINETACKESHENLKKTLKFNREQSYLNIDALKLMNPQLKNQGILPEKIHDLIGLDNGVDFIIANPPWGANISLSKDELVELGYELTSGQFDSYELIVELSLLLLKEEGYMGLILPDSLFLYQHKAFRDLLLKNTSIKLIYKIGEGFFPGVYRSTVLLILQKKSPLNNNVHCLSLNQKQRLDVLSGDNTLKYFERKYSYTIPQSRFSEDSESRFDISISNDAAELKLINKIESDKLVWDYFESGRGIELSKTGLVEICQNCHTITSKSKNATTNCKECNGVDTKYIDKIIFKEPQENYEPVLAGEDVTRYSITCSHYIKTEIDNFKYKRDNLQTDKPKLLVRKTGLGISASIDYDNRLSLQTVFHFVAKKHAPKYITVEYITGILNSRVILYYHLKKHGETEWKSHPYLTQSNIKNLPIPMIDEDDLEKINIANQITKTVKKLTRTDNSSAMFTNLDLQVEFLVMKLYGITAHDFKIINTTIENAHQLKSISALKLPNNFKLINQWQFNTDKKEFNNA